MTFSESRIVIYWAVSVVLQMLPKILYSGYRQYEKWEMDEAYPQYKRVLRLYPLLSTGVHSCGHFTIESSYTMR